MVEHWVRNFEHRCKVLFIEGQIMTMKNTYVAQILEFYRDPSIIFAAKHAIMFVKPEGTDEEAMFEPLERIRVIVGNVFQCLRAAVPDTSWRYQFMCFALPSPLGPTKPGKDSVRKLMKKFFLQLFRRANHSDPEKTLKEMLILLPVAEKHSKTGLTNRQSWTVASLEHPDLLWGREGVTLLLGAYITTSNIERFLRRVGNRHHLSKYENLNDMVLCDLHAPMPTKVAHVDRNLGRGGQTPRTIIPKGVYLDKVIGTYHTHFGGRCWRKQPKDRRDAGVKKDEAKVAASRKRKRKPATEGSFIRARENEIKEVLKQPPEERLKRRADCVHGPVPADTEKYLSKASVDLRNQAEKRKQLKFNRATKERKARIQGNQLVNWVSKPLKDVDHSGQTLYAPDLKLVLVAVSSGSSRAIQNVLSLSGVAVDSWPKYIREVICNGHAPEAAMVVVRRLMGHAWQDDWGVCCMIIGGFLTSEKWLAEAVTAKARPTGVFYPGLLKNGLMIHICSSIQDKLPRLFDLLLTLESLGKITLMDLPTLRKAWNEYQAARGLRSQPWKKMVGLCWDAEGKKALERDLKDTERPILLTLPEFFSRHCPIRREVVCAGKWLPENPLVLQDV